LRTCCGCPWEAKAEDELGERHRRVVEHFGLEGTLNIFQFQLPCHGQGPLPPAQGAPSPVEPGLEPCQGGGSHSSSGQPGLGPHYPQREEFPPYIQSKSLLFQFKAVTPCPITPRPCHSPSPALSQPLQALAAALRSACSLLLLRLTSPSSPSLSCQQRGSSPCIIAGASSGPAPTAPALSCAEGSRAGRRTSVGSHQSGAEGHNPLPCPVPTLLGMQPGAWLAFWAASAHCQVMDSFSSPSTPKSFSTGLPSIPSPPACMDTRGCSNPGAGPCTWPC